MTTVAYPNHFANNYFTDLLSNKVASKERSCDQCEKSISHFDVYIEYEASFYHETCFRCSHCSEAFMNKSNIKSSNNLLDLNTVPCKNSANKLFCMVDFISQNFNCKLCSNGFNVKSQVCQLEGLPVHEQDNLAHFECLFCKKCNQTIAGQYSIKKEADNKHYDIYCKSCSINKSTDNNKTKAKSVNQSNKHRLSSRQKEILKTKFSTNNLNSADVLNEKNSVILNRLAKDMRCSVKSVSSYISKYQNKLNELAKKNYVTELSTVEFMVSELKKLDRVVAPNQSPFNTQNTKKPNNHVDELLSYQSFSANLIPNKSPFEDYSPNSSANSFIKEN